MTAAMFRTARDPMVELLTNVKQNEMFYVEEMDFSKGFEFVAKELKKVVVRSRFRHRRVNFWSPYEAIFYNIDEKLAQITEDELYRDFCPLNVILGCGEIGCRLIILSMAVEGERIGALIVCEDVAALRAEILSLVQQGQKMLKSIEEGHLLN